MLGGFRFTTSSGHTIHLTNLHSDANLRTQFPWLEATLQKRMAELLSKGPLHIEPSESKVDGICYAQVSNADDVWVQERLVLDGLAPVTHLPHHDRFFSFIMAAEREARHLQAGIWERPDAFVRNSVSINDIRLENSYQFAVGRIGFARDFNRIILVCIDKDPWRSWCSWFLRDAYIEMRDEQGIDMLDEKQVIGRRVLMRGDLINRDGLRAFMPLPELIEFLSEDTALLH